MDPGFFLRFVLRSIKGIYLSQDIDAGVVGETSRSAVYLSNSLNSKWRDLYQVDSEIDPPFTIHWKAQVEFFQQMMLMGRFNYKNILHLTNSIKFGNINPLRTTSRSFVVEQSLNDLVHLEKDKCLLTFTSKVNNDQGLVFELLDEILLRRVSRSDSEKVSTSKNENPIKKIRTFNIEKAEETLLTQLNFSKSTGIRYGVLSGDLNPIHTIPALSRLMGHKHPFTAGLCTSNAIIAELAKSGVYPKHIKSFYSKPVLMSVDHELHVSSNSFSLRTVDGKVCCFGEMNV